MGWIVRLNGKGRIVIPREVRDKLGLVKGSALMLDVRDSELVITAFTPKTRERVKGGELKEFLKV